MTFYCKKLLKIYNIHDKILPSFLCFWFLQFIELLNCWIPLKCIVFLWKKVKRRMLCIKKRAFNTDIFYFITLMYYKNIYKTSTSQSVYLIISSDSVGLIGLKLLNFKLTHLFLTTFVRYSVVELQTIPASHVENSSH